ncbi:MAG: aminotransferase class I/II-fold pyridoxal phosphate-dependent enzyme [Legionella sp.]|nr:aminotransferase class I/II-fold pyridoxal phosphate-dependent enzyme [Legionella sp.]
MAQGFIGLFYETAYKNPHKKLFRYLNDGHPIDASYGELDYKARQIAQRLRAMGAPGDRVLIMHKQGIDFITSFLGCAYAQMIAVPIMPPINQEVASKLALVIENAKPIACLTSQEIYSRLSKLKIMGRLEKHRLLSPLVHKMGGNILQKFEPLIAANIFSLNWVITDAKNLGQAELFHLPVIDPQSPLFLQYTSGSTGNPKGVIVTQENVLHNIECIRYGLNIQDHDILYSWLPFFHDMGLIGCILTPMHTGLYTIWDSPINFLKNPVGWIKGIAEYQCTITAAPNFAYELAANKATLADKNNLDLSCLRVAVNSAEPIRISTWNKFYEAFRGNGLRDNCYYPSYGLAEATLFVTTQSVQEKFKTLTVDSQELRVDKVKFTQSTDKNAKILVSSGDVDPSLKQNKIIIVNPNTYVQLADGAIGEIWLDNPSVSPGYWQNEEATREVFGATLADDSQTKYLRTGDLGFIYEEQLYVTGRMKDLIIIRGKNYYPQDIELSVEQAHVAVRAGCVNAFSVLDAEAEQLVVLAEVKQDKDCAQIALALLNAIMQQHGITPDTIVLLPPKTLKKTTSGKVRRREMKKMFLENEFNPLYVWQNDKDSSTDPVAQRNDSVLQSNSVVFNILQQILRQDEAIQPQSRLAELGLDSVHIMEFFSQLKNSLPEHVEITPEFLLENPTIEEVVTRIEAQLGDEICFQSLATVTKVKGYSEEEQKYWQNICHLPEYIPLVESKKLLGNDGVVNELYFNTIGGVSADRILVNGKEYINFSGYNYLGYAGDERVIAATQEAIAQYGTSVSASRLVSGQKPIHGALEQEIAALIGAEDAVVFTAGHATNVSVITLLYSAEDVIFHDELIHNSSLQGAVFSRARRISFPHNDYQALAKLMAQERSHYRRALVLVEGAYSMDGDIPNIPEFISVKNQYHADLMIDEAHSLGVIGATGRGVREYFNLEAEDVELWMGTLSKAFASCGGYIAGKKELIEFIKCACGGFVFSAGITPANAAAALTSIRLMKEEPHRPKKLQENAINMLTHLRKHGVNTGASHDTPIIPIIVGDEAKAIKLSLKLRQEGVYTIPIVYPAVPKGMARIRLFLSYLHTEEQLATTAELIAQYLLVREVV